MVAPTDTVSTILPVTYLGKTGLVLVVCLTLALAGAWAWFAYVQKDKMKRWRYGIAAMVSLVLMFATIFDHSHYAMDRVLCVGMIGCALYTLYRAWVFRNFKEYQYTRLTVALRCLTFFVSLVLAASYRLYADPLMTQPRLTGLAVMAIEVFIPFILVSAGLVAFHGTGIIARRFQHDGAHAPAASTHRRTVTSTTGG